MYRSYLLRFLLIFFSFSIYAQEGYLKGYVILNNGDTMKGMLKDRKFVNGTMGWQKVLLRDAMGRKYRFDPEEIREYKREGKLKNVTLVVGVEGKSTFVEVQEEGTVVLYAFNRGTWGGAGNAVVVQTSANGPKEHVEFFLQKAGKPNSLMEWRPRDYKTTAKIFFGDNTALMNQISKDELKDEDIRMLVKKYNQGYTGN